MSRAENAAEMPKERHHVSALIRRATSVGQGLHESAGSRADPIRTTTGDALFATGAALTSGVEDAMNRVTCVIERIAEGDRVQAKVNHAEVGGHAASDTAGFVGDGAATAAYKGAMALPGGMEKLINCSTMARLWLSTTDRGQPLQTLEHRRPYEGPHGRCRWARR